MEPREVGRSEELGLPHTLVVGSYGGGDAFRAAAQVLVMDLTPGLVAESDRVWEELYLTCAEGQASKPLREVVWDEVRKEHARQLLVPPEQRIVNLPAVLPSSSSGACPAEVKWQLRLQVSERLVGASYYNLFYQGWLFAEEVKEEGRLGVTRWPLVGLFNTMNLARPVHNYDLIPTCTDTSHQEGEEDVTHVGIDCLRPADQHVHLVQETLDLDGCPFETSDWHLGSDMSRFVMVDERQSCSVAWAVCADLDTLRCEVSLLLLVDGFLARHLRQHVRTGEMDQLIDLLKRSADREQDASSRRAINTLQSTRNACFRPGV